MFVSTRYTLTHRATQALSAATVTMGIDRGSASKRRPMAGQAPLRRWRSRLCQLLHEIFDLALSTGGKITDHLFQRLHGYRISRAHLNRNPTGVEIGRKTGFKL